LKIGGENLIAFIMTIEAKEDRDKVADIYRLYSGTMLYMANSVLNEIHLAEDAVSEAFIKIIDNIEKIDTVDCYRTRGFVVIIVRNVAIDILRKQRRNQIVSFGERNEDFGYEELAFDNISVKEACFKIISSIEGLKKEYSDILYLKLEFDCSYEEIGKILSISPENAKMRLFRARKALKKELKREEDYCDQ
jgi:RNA polymerase sigma-70 factor, ECF subfamily